MIFFVNALAFSAQYTAHGNWSDSSLYDEAIRFMNHVHPEMTDAIESIKKDGDYDSYEQMVSCLPNSVPSHVRGLLKLSLALRIFHPKAALENPRENSPLLRGWIGTVPKQLPSFDHDDIQWKVLSEVFEPTDGVNRLEKLRQIVHQPNVWLPRLARKPVNVNMKSSHEELKLIDYVPYSLINGRAVSSQAIDIGSALVSEYQNVVIMSQLNISEADRRGIIYGNPDRKVFEYIPPLPGTPVTQIDAIEESRRKWRDVLDANTTKPVDFLFYRRPLVETQVFLDVNSPEAKAILEIMIDSCRTALPYTYSVFVLGNMANETERRIMYSFRETVIELSVRVGCEYLLDGLSCGFEKAYKKIRPKTPWNKLDKLVNTSRCHEYIQQQLAYTGEHDIQELAIFVNGQRVHEVPAFTQIKKEIIEQGLRLMDHAHRGQATKDTDFDVFYRENGIPMKSSAPPLTVGRWNRLTIEGLSVGKIYGLLEVMTRTSPVHISCDERESRIPVWFSNGGTPKDLSFDAPPFEVREIDGCELQNGHNVTLRMSPSGTIVGPLVFNYTLTSEQLRYTLHYVRLAFMDMLADALNAQQMFYVMLWRSSQGLTDVTRSYPPERNLPSTINVKGFAGLEWTCLANPFERDFRMTVEMIKCVASLGIAGVSLVPVVPNGGVDCKDMNDVVFPVVMGDGVDIDDGNIVVEMPDNWIYVRRDESITVTAIASYGIAPGAGVIKIGQQRRVALNDGYFVVVLPIGKYDTHGLGDEAFDVNSLVPEPHFFTSSNDQVDVDVDDRLHVLLCPEHGESFIDTKMMMHTLLKNVSTQVKVWSFGDVGPVLAKACDAEILPRFHPYGFPAVSRQRNFVDSSLALIDIFIPPEVTHILVLGAHTLFRGDAASFNRLDMDGSVFAAPSIDSDSRALFWNQGEYPAERFKRPFHNAALVWVEMSAWRSSGAGSLFRNMYATSLLHNVHCSQISDELITLLQLRVQVLTLPESTAYCNKYNPSTSAASAFSIHLCDSSSRQLLGFEYEDIESDARQLF